MDYICFDIGGTWIKYGILNDEYKILEKDQIATEANLGGKQILDKLVSLITTYKQKYRLNGVAISTAGVVNQKNGVILYANDIIPNYTGLEVSKIIEEKTALKTSVENDVNCFALSHILLNNKDYLMLTIGTGIGGAIVINKQVYHGISNSAGEFGQMIINCTKFENLASLSALVRVGKKLGLDVNNGLDVFNLYDNNNQLAKKALNYFYKNLATGLLNLAYIFNFPTIFLGGGITNRKTFLDELMIEIERIADYAYYKSKILISPNTNDGGLIGALVHFNNIYID